MMQSSHVSCCSDIQHMEPAFVTYSSAHYLNYFPMLWLPRRTRGCCSPDRMGRLWLRLLGLVCVPLIQPRPVRKLLDNHSNPIQADLPKVQTQWRLGPPDKIMSNTQMSGWLTKREHSDISSSGSVVCGRNEAWSPSLCLDHLPFCIMDSACVNICTQQHPPSPLCCLIIIF